MTNTKNAQNAQKAKKSQTPNVVSEPLANAKKSQTPNVVSEPLANAIDMQNLPTPKALAVPQHIICQELAKLGYRAKQASEISGIKLTNVSWYYSKYKLNAIAIEALAKLNNK